MFLIWSVSMLFCEVFASEPQDAVHVCNTTKTDVKLYCHSNTRKLWGFVPVNKTKEDHLESVFNGFVVVPGKTESYSFEQLENGTQALVIKPSLSTAGLYICSKVAEGTTACADLIVVNGSFCKGVPHTNGKVTKVCCDIRFAGNIPPTVQLFKNGNNVENLKLEVTDRTTFAIHSHCFDEKSLSSVDNFTCVISVQQQASQCETTWSTDCSEDLQCHLPASGQAGLSGAGRTGIIIGAVSGAVATVAVGGGIVWYNKRKSNMLEKGPGQNEELVHMTGEMKPAEQT